MNASLASIRAGLRPVVQQTLRGVQYFQFRNGQVRRQIGEGHSHQERRARRLAKRERVRRLKLGNHFFDPRAEAIANAAAVGRVLQHFHDATRRDADRAALSSV